MDAHTSSYERLVGRSEPPPHTSRRRRPRAVLALALVLAGVQPAVAIGSSRRAPSLHSACGIATQHAQTVIRAWLKTYARGSATPCRLNAASYHPSEPPFGRYRIALVQPLTPESQPRRRLYLVVLINSRRAGRYLIDLHPDTGGRWHVDLWAEL